MAIGVRLHFPNATTAQYDEVLRLMGLTQRGAGPAGLLFHWAAEDSGGMLVTDVWRELERFEQFARDEIGPFSRQAGITAAPETALSVVYNYNFRPAGELPLPGAPIAVVMDYEGSLAQYDEVMDMMDIPREGPGPEGNLFHWVSEVDGVIRITDVWQDRETFDDFAEHQIKPYTTKVGVAAPATVTFYDLHNYFTAGA
jgi:hypothetical protein